MSKRSLLIIISILLMFGGLVRIFASKSLFQAFMMGHLWMDHPFFIYIYRLLGAVIVWIGIILLVVAKEPAQYRTLIRASMIGLGLFFATSLLTGFLSGLQIQFFIVDSVFTLFLIVIFFYIQRE